MRLLTGTAIAALLAVAPALAEDAEHVPLKEQIETEGAIGPVKPNSGPGVQGAPDTRTGPATRSPGGSAEATDPTGSASSGASTGEAGASGNVTTPSQDASGVQGFPDTRTGPATRAPADDGNGSASE